MKNFRKYFEAQGELTSNQATSLKKRYFYDKNLNPDSAIREFGDPSKFTAFIYSSSSNTLFCQPGDEYHSIGMGRPQSALRLVLSEPKTSRFIFGRFGEIPNFSGFVTTWFGAPQESDHGERTDSVESGDMRYGLPVGNRKILVKMLRSMVDGTAKIVGNSPAKYPITEDYVFSQIGMDIQTVGEFLGSNNSQQEDPCQNLAKINVRGRDMNLGMVLANLHMVRGPELDYIKSAFCSSYSTLKDTLKDSCPQQYSLLQDIATRIGGCSAGNEEWEKAKKRGANQYRQQLRTIFKNPERIDMHLGNQRNIDAAWDFLNKKENILDFKGWLNYHG